METAREILFILQRPADLPPSRSICVLAWLKQKQMLSFRVAHMSDRDVLRENHFYGLSAVGMTRKSRTRHPGLSFDSPFRNSRGEENTSARKPTDSRRFLTAERIALSSSITKTVGSAALMQ